MLSLRSDVPEIEFPCMALCPSGPTLGSGVMGSRLGPPIWRSRQNQVRFFFVNVKVRNHDLCQDTTSRLTCLSADKSHHSVMTMLRLKIQCVFCHCPMSRVLQPSSRVCLQRFTLHSLNDYNCNAEITVRWARY
jgi:hypothetical protein